MVRKHGHWFFIVVALALAACKSAQASTPKPSMPVIPTPVESRSTPAAQPAHICPVSPTVNAQPPKDPNADPFGFGPWFINADRTMWAGLDSGWVAGENGNKVIWIRPAGTSLVVSGHRLDGDAPPLRADIPCCYETGFQVTGLYFSTEGCWEVTATAGKSQLQFVVAVPPIENP